MGKGYAASGYIRCEVLCVDDVKTAYPEKSTNMRGSTFLKFQSVKVRLNVLSAFMSSIIRELGFSIVMIGTGEVSNYEFVARCG